MPAPVRTRFHIKPTPQIPPAPTGLTAMAGDGLVTLSWNAAVDATSYNVYQGTSSGGEGVSPVQTVFGNSNTTAVIGGLTNGMTYYFKVDASNGRGTSPQSAEASATPQSAGSAQYPASAFNTIETPNDSVPNFTKSPNIFSAASGNWSSPATWNLGRVPQAGDIVGIKTTHTITYDVVSTAAVVGVGVCGTLSFRTDISTKLTVQHLIVYGPETLGAGNYGALIQGNNDVSTSIDPAVTCEVVFSDVAIDAGTDSAFGTDPKQYGNGFLCYGKWRANGAAKTPFVRLSAELSAGATTLPLGSAVSGWRAGDRLYIPDSRHLYPDITPEVLWPSFVPQSDLPTLSSVGGGGTSLTVPAITYGHEAAKDVSGTPLYYPHVANLTRNIIFRSANPAGTRGHIFITHRADVDARYVLSKDMGRTTFDPLNSTSTGHIGTNQIGRYAFHLHHVLGVYPTVTPTYQVTVLGCVTDHGDSVAQPFKWGITLHDTGWALIQDNVMHNAGGAGYMEEQGTETQGLVIGNMVTRGHGPNRTNDRGDGRTPEFGWEGSGFWLRGYDNSHQNNVACECRAGGFRFFPYSNGTSEQYPTFRGADPTIDFVTKDIRTVPIRKIDGCEAYGGWTNEAMQIWALGNQNHTVLATMPRDTNVVKNCVFWHFYAKGIYGYEHEGVTFDSCVFVGRKDRMNLSGMATAFYAGDYVSRNMSIKNCSAHGLYGGFAAGLTDSTTTLVQNCFFSCWKCIVANAQYATGGAAIVLTRQIDVKNCTFADTGLTDVSNGSTSYYIDNTINPEGSFTNWRKLDRLDVYQYQGSVGDNFHCFATGQAPSAIMPPDGSGDLGTPEPGTTNATNQSVHAYSTKGEVSTSTNTRTKVNGYCTAF